MLTTFPLLCVLTLKGKHTYLSSVFVHAKHKLSWINANAYDGETLYEWDPWI